MHGCTSVRLAGPVRHSADKALCLLSGHLASLSAPGGRQACDPTGEAGRGAKGVPALYGLYSVPVLIVLVLNWSR